jgi:DNA-binding NtrC family response regulator
MHVLDDREFRVLVVDDEQIIADTLAMILNHSGFTAKAVYSGEVAVMQASEWPPSALICDVVMPGISGPQAAAAILRIAPQCHVMLFSGHGTLDIGNRIGECTFEILAKPVHPQEILRRLKNVRESRRISVFEDQVEPEGVQE